MTADRRAAAGLHITGVRRREPLDAAWRGEGVRVDPSQRVEILFPVSPPAWTKRAACRIVTPEQADAWFFGSNGHTLMAETLCSECPVMAECAAASVGEHGYWAGTTAAQRDGVGT